MINVGSVGQPRDGDDRACDAIPDDGEGADAQPAPWVAFRRVPYDLEITIRRIRDIPH